MRISDWSSDVCSSDLSSDDGTGRWVPLHGGRMTTDQINIDDLRERAKTMHDRALMHHYGVTGGKMHRMPKKNGIKAATSWRTERAYSSSHAYLPAKTGTMNRSDMAMTYGGTHNKHHIVLHRTGP